MPEAARAALREALIEPEEPLSPRSSTMILGDLLVLAILVAPIAAAIALFRLDAAAIAAIFAPSPN